MVMFCRTRKLLNGQEIEDDQEKEILIKKNAAAYSISSAYYGQRNITLTTGFKKEKTESQ